MASPNPWYGGWNSSSGSRGTPSSFPYSPSSNASSGLESRSHRNPVKAAARSFAGAFATCFTPPEKEISQDLGEGFKPTSEVSRHGYNGKQGSTRGSRFSLDLSAHERESGPIHITMDEIRKATKNFSPSTKIGQGGFGTVYKGKLDGTLVAIKRAKKNVYDNNSSVEFKSEIQTFAKVEHLSLVRFYGYLEHEDERIIVVEYVPNGNLREHLDGIHGQIIDLGTRLDIAIDVSHALTYLHTYTDHPIIHRDVKSSNILLNEKFRAKVADFGFSRLAADCDATHVSTQVKGTAGYLDPEYLRTYQLTEKSDVYSFGVLLVELVTGRRPLESKRELDQRVTHKWAMKKFMGGEAGAILDPNLELTPANNLALEKILELSLQCLAPRRQSRPSMRRCSEILWSIRKDYRELSAPDFRSLSLNSQRNCSSSVREK